MKKTESVGLLLIIFALFFVFAGMMGTKKAASDSAELVITGMIEQHGATFVLKKENDLEYQIQGQDLSDIVGKKVKAIGLNP